MNLMTPKSRSARLLHGAALGLGLAAVALVVGCGRMPEEPFWEPNADDSAGIKSVVEANKDLFRTDFAEGMMLVCDTVWPGTTLARFRREMRENPFKPRFRVNEMEHVFFTDSFDLEWRFVATLDTARMDTTCTVFFAETIPGVMKLRAFSRTRYLRDSVIGEDTLEFYDTLFTAVDSVIEKRIDAITSNGAVLKKEAGAWKLWKYAGGSRLWAPTPDDAPYLDRIYITNGPVEDTFLLRPDTLQHGVQRFYEKDELTTFRVGDSIRVRSLLTTVLDAKNLFYFDGARYEFKASDKIPLTQPGLYRLYTEQVPINVLYETGEYVGLVWSTLINVVE